LKAFTPKIVSILITSLIITAVAPLATAQSSSDSNSSLAKPYIVIFDADGRPINSSAASPYVFYTDDENATIRLKVGMTIWDNWLLFGYNVTSVYFNASWEKNKDIVLYRGESDPLFFNLSVPYGNQSIEVHATGIVHQLYSIYKDNHFIKNSDFTICGDSTQTFVFNIAPNPTPTPKPNASTLSPDLEQTLAIITVVIVVASVLSTIFYKRSRPKMLAIRQ
jgi:hypothetical protein